MNARLRTNETGAPTAVHSTPGLSPAGKAGRKIGLLPRLFGPLFDVSDDVADRLQLFGIFIRNFDRKLLLEGHHELYRVQRVSAEILNEGSVRRNLLRIDAKLFDDDLLHLFFDRFL